MPARRRSWSLLVGVAAVALFGLGATPAMADIPWAGCLAANYQCGKLAVPLDHAGKIPGTVEISVTRKVAASNPSRTAIVAFAGGPGQAAQPFAREFATMLKAGLGDKDLLVFDQRGTGKSGSLSCAALKDNGGLDLLIARCSNELGARRAFYTSGDSVADLEDLRIAGGYDHLILYGVSYGTKVALAYAAAHPAQTSALILDSTVLPEGPDSLRRSTATAVPRVIGDDLCAAGACKGATPNAVHDLKVLAAQLDKRSIRAAVFDGRGRRYTASLGVNGLLDLMTAGDLNPAIRAQLPAAVRSALKGDRQPLLRLSANSAGLDNGESLPGVTGLQSEEDEEFGDGALYLATLCEENPTFPWTRGASLSQRTKQLADAVDAAPAGTWGIFPKSVGLGSFAGTCLGWNTATAAAPVAGVLPNVPVLVLSGQADLRTPLEDAQQIVSRFPQGKLVQIPQVGHSVMTAEYGTCAKDAVATFLKGAVIAACAPVENPFTPTTRAPRSLADVKKAASLPSKAGRTLNVLPATLVDVRRAIIGEILTYGQVPTTLGGLRGGSVKVKSQKQWTLRRYELVPGVQISGTYRQNGSSTFTFSGAKAASGAVTLSKSGRATGRLGGSKVNVKPRAGAASVTTGLPSLADALKLARASAVGG